MELRIDEIQVKQHMLRARIMTQQDLARKAGLDNSTVTRALAGDNFRADTLVKLADTLRVHPFDLLVADGAPAPHLDAPALVAL
jgi:DNA-binding Xre family transcriptional regulator